MPGHSPVAPGLRRAVLVAISSLILGCGSGSELARLGVSGLAPPPSWKSAPNRPAESPGKVLATWDGPSGASLSVYTTLPGPKLTARGLGLELTSRLEHMPEMRVLKSEVIRPGELEGCRVEVVAPGTGRALAATGLGSPKGPAGVTLVPTRRVFLGVPRGADTLWLAWTYPESARGAVEPEVEAMTRTLSIRDRRSQAY